MVTNLQKSRPGSCQLLPLQAPPSPGPSGRTAPNTVGKLGRILSPLLLLTSSEFFFSFFPFQFFSVIPCTESLKRLATSWIRRQLFPVRFRETYLDGGEGQGTQQDRAVMILQYLGACSEGVKGAGTLGHTWRGQSLRRKHHKPWK